MGRTLLHPRAPGVTPLEPSLHTYWSLAAASLLATLRSNPNGLSTAEARARLETYGFNILEEGVRQSALRLFLRQFASPLVLILILAAVVSGVVQEWLDAAIILLIVLGSALLTFVQEHRASAAVDKLKAYLSPRATVLRDGQPCVLPARDLVPGDVILLSAGSLVPADGVILEAKDFFLNQAILTGETFPVQKEAGVAPAAASLAARCNCVFMGTSVRSGSARALLVQTGRSTVYGAVAGRLSLRRPDTEFERGIRQFGILLSQIVLLLVLLVFAINVFLDKPPVSSLLFAIALAVGMSPELLPAIISIMLSRGAQDMVARGVIVRRLSAIENLGSMDILCTDKTGTLTEGVVRLDAALDSQGQASERVLLDAYLNASLQAGLTNPLDEAVVACAEAQGLNVSEYRKLDELPYDFVRKRLSVVVQTPEQAVLITKGAFESVLACCRSYVDGPTTRELEPQVRRQLEKTYESWGGQGYRVLGVARKPVVPGVSVSTKDEYDLIFTGFLLFFDPPKAGAQEALKALSQLGVKVKVITGDNCFVARQLASAVGLSSQDVLTGGELQALNDEALWHLAPRTSLFVEVDPNQKERIILALKKMGHVVGYLGDGINDAPALHAADAGISVDKAVDVAKSAADLVLLEHDLGVLCQGILEGRRIFANTLKYIYTTTSANFGNMISMAGASLLLPFLPLLAKQILLNNFLSDLPAMTITGDKVDKAWISTPHSWDINIIRSFMLRFGLISSAFDYLTFAVLWFLVGAMPAPFRTGWFVVSLLTELLILLIIRTQQPLWQSKPSIAMLASSALVAAFALLLPYLPLGAFFDFVPLPIPVVVLILVITFLYAAVSEFEKRRFFRVKPSH